MTFGNITSGILFMLASSFGFALMNAFAKMLSNHIPSMETVFFRSVTMVIIILGIYVYQFIKKENKKPSKSKKKGGWLSLFIRVVSGGLAMMAIFYNIATIPLGTTMAFSQSVPIYAVIMGAIFLKERLSPIIILATIIGFGGILIISNPDFNGISLVNVLLGIFSAVGMAVAFVTLRTLKEYFDNTFIILAFGVGSTILGFMGMFIPVSGVGGFVAPSIWEWILIIGMGVSGTFAQHFLNKAYIIAPVGIVSPIDYSRIIFSIILGVMLGDPIPNLMTSTGISLIIISGLLIATPAILNDLRKINRAKKTK